MDPPPSDRKGEDPPHQTQRNPTESLTHTPTLSHTHTKGGSGRDTFSGQQEKVGGGGGGGGGGEVEKVEAGEGGVGEGREEQQYVTSLARIIGVTLTTSLAMIVNICSVQAMTLALPTIGADLGIQEHNLQWLVSAYALTSGCFLLLFGRLADLYGHKRVFLLGTLWFCVWSIGCGFAQNEIGIDVMRGLQGLGAAANIPAALGILGKSIPPGPTKSAAFATFAAGAPLGASFGLVAGGLLTQFAPVTWRAFLYVVAGIAFLIAVCGFLFIPPDLPLRRLLNPPPGEDRSVDWIGAALSTVGLVLFTFALADGEGAPNGWSTPYIPTLFSISVVLLIIFVFWEYHMEFRTDRAPLMRVSFWAKGRVAVVLGVAFLSWCCFTGQSFFATLFYQEYQHLSASLTTTRFVPMAVTGIAINFIVSQVVSFVPAQILFMLGSLGNGLAAMLFAIQDPQATYWRYNFPSMILTVFGADFVFAVGTLYCSKVADREEQALAGGLFNLLTQLGTAFGLAIETIVQDRVITARGRDMGVEVNKDQTNAPPEALLEGLRAAFWTCFAFAMASLALATLGLYGIGTVGDKHSDSVGVLEGLESAAEKAQEGPHSAVSTIVGEDSGKKSPNALAREGGGGALPKGMDSEREEASKEQAERGRSEKQLEAEEDYKS